MARRAVRPRDQEGRAPHRGDALERRAVGAGRDLQRCDRLFFAGEAAHETLWGTVGGAWESGERAADAVLRRLAGIADPAEETTPKPEPAARPRRPPQQKRPPRQQPRRRERSRN
jgi:hypothetical protein